ncbi:MAG: sigma-70 family RNA polymerase sigma factor [Planctomycetota bacterium]
MSTDPDRDLVRRCQVLGSQEFEAAFGELYQRYRDKVYSLAYRIVGNPTDALDAAQEAFVLLYQKLETFQFDSKFSSWLYRLVVNASIDQIRRSKSRRARREVPLDPQDHLNLPDVSGPDPSASAEQKDEADSIQRAIDRLSDKLRIVTVLRYQQNLSYEQLAEVLGISIGTVKSRLSRAHAALAGYLGVEAGTDDAGGREGRDAS